MRKNMFSLCLLFSALLLPWAAIGAYLESDYGPTSSTKAHEPGVRPEPEPARENPVTWLIRNVEVGTAWNYENLTVFPLVLHDRPRNSDIRTLDEAFSRNWIAVREKDNAQVSVLEVRNDSRDYVFLMAGEILAGGKQNRMIRSDILLQPNSGYVEIPVYCGEKERWSQRYEGFNSAGSVAHFELRSGAAKGASQDAIWHEIDAQSERAKVSSPTRNYQQVYEDKAVSRQLDEYSSHFRRLPERQTVGVVAVSGGRIIGCDIFSDPDLFSRLWHKLLRSYSMDVLYRERQTSSRLTSNDARRFIDRALSARYDERQTPGAGRLYDISGPTEGLALTWNGETVHATLFGETRFQAPPPPPPPPPLPWPPEPRPLWEHRGGME